MSDEEHHRLNVRLFLRAAGWQLTEQPEARGSERWRAVHLDTGAVLTNGDLEYLAEQALRQLREWYLAAHQAARPPGPGS